MRDYLFIDKYLNELQEDIYPQPPDPIHTVLAHQVIIKWANNPEYPINDVLDVGCGQGFCSAFFRSMGIEYTGITLGKDYDVCREAGLHVYKMDFSFLTDLVSDYSDLIFARHVLEHSPMPLLTLMEWHRVCGEYLILVSPKPSYWGRVGRNHYSVLERDHLEFLLIRAGFEIIEEDHSEETEFRFFCKKLPREGWQDRFQEFLPKHFAEKEAEKVIEKPIEEELEGL